MAESEKKKRKMVTVFDERSGNYKDYPLEPTTMEKIREGFEGSSTRAEIEAARKYKSKGK